MQRSNRIQHAFDTARAPRVPFEFWAFASAYSNAMRAIDGRAGLVTLIGPAGSGKSTLLRTIQSVRTRHHGFVLFRSRPTGGLDELLGSLLADLRITSISAAREYRLEALTEHLNQRPKPSVLLVDDAHLATDKALGGLAALAMYRVGESASLQVVMAGDSQLENRLQRPTLAWIPEHVGARVQLDPLSAEEVGDYIVHRLTDARRPFLRVWGTKNPFVPAAMNEVVRYSNGLPGTVNRICRSALSGASNDVDITAVDRAASECGLAPAGWRPEDRSAKAAPVSESILAATKGMAAARSARLETRGGLRRVATAIVVLAVIAGGAAAFAYQPQAMRHVISQVDGVATMALAAASNLRGLIAAHWPDFDSVTAQRGATSAVAAANVSPSLRSGEAGSPSPEERRQATLDPPHRIASSRSDEETLAVQSHVRQPMALSPPSGFENAPPSAWQWPPAPPRSPDKEISFGPASSRGNAAGLVGRVSIDGGSARARAGDSIVEDSVAVGDTRPSAPSKGVHNVESSLVEQRIDARNAGPLVAPQPAAEAAPAGSPEPNRLSKGVNENESAVGWPSPSERTMLDGALGRPSEPASRPAPAIAEPVELKDTVNSAAMSDKALPPSAPSAQQTWPSDPAESARDPMSDGDVSGPARQIEIAGQEMPGTLPAQPGSLDSMARGGPDDRPTAATGAPLPAADAVSLTRLDQTEAAERLPQTPSSDQPRSETKPQAPMLMARVPDAAPKRAAVLPPDWLMARGNALMQSRDPASARLLFERAAAQGEAGANVAVGQTFDPLELRRLGVIGMRGQPELALEWYRRAAAAGDPRSHQLIARLEVFVASHKQER